MACPDFFSDLSFSRYNSLIWIGAVGCFHKMWLSELRTFTMFWDLKSYSIVETDTLWYDLPEILNTNTNTNTYVISNAMHVCSLHQCPEPVWPPLWTIHCALWTSQCKSSWSCMNWKLGSKHLYVARAVIPHAAMICASRRWSEGPSLRDGRYVNKLSNLLSLTECGFYDHLEKDRLFYLNMDV